jgi:hypothetical protein
VTVTVTDARGASFVDTLEVEVLSEDLTVPGYGPILGVLAIAFVALLSMAQRRRTA